MLHTTDLYCKLFDFGRRVKNMTYLDLVTLITLTLLQLYETIDRSYTAEKSNFVLAVYIAVTKLWT